MRYEKWSLGYWIFKKYVTLIDRFIHKKIVITGKKDIPKNKPILFAPNHQNALCDPLAVLLNNSFQPVWLARADIFNRSRITDWLLRSFKIMPVYRMHDGKENLIKNEITFADSIKVLENNFALALFPEAAHSRKRQMLIHKKAVPRIVFMAEEKTDYSLDIQVIPTGIYYSSYWKFNRELIVNYGKPIAVTEYIDLYKQNQNAATLALQKRIHDEILPLVININSRIFYDEFEKIREFYSGTFLKREKKPLTTLNLFYAGQAISAKLDDTEKTNFSVAEELAEKVVSYFETVRKYKIRNWLVDKKETNPLKLIGDILLAIVGVPFFIVGFIFNALPFFLIDRFVRKKIKDTSFWSSFILVASIVVFPLFYLVEFFAVAGFIPGIALKILFLVSWPFFGKIAFNWYILSRKIIGRWRIMKLNWFDKKNYNLLLEEKQVLTNQLDSLFFN